MHLTEEQLAALHCEDNLCLMSCPGSGKTRLIIAKILQCLDRLPYETAGVACITHTNAGVDEILYRLQSFGVDPLSRRLEVSTIHSFIIRHLIQPYGHLLPELRDGYEFAYSDNEQLRGKLEDLIVTYRLKPFVLDELENLRWDDSENPLPMRGVPYQALVELSQWIKENHLITMNRCLRLGSRIISVAPFIVPPLSCRFPWILIDEFQDTSEDQLKIVEALVGCGTSRFLCVGDVNQSIYGFSGARPDLINRFATENGFRTDLRLTNNFRSSERIVDLANNLVGSQVMVAAGENATADWIPYLYRVESVADGISSEFLPAVKSLSDDESPLPLGRVAILASWWQPLYHLGRELRQRGVPVIGPGARPYKRDILVTPLVEAIGALITSDEPAVFKALQRAYATTVGQVGEADARVAYSYRGQVGLWRIIEQVHQLDGYQDDAPTWIRKFLESVGEILWDSGLASTDGVRRISESSEILQRTLNERQQGMTVEDLGVFARPDQCIQLLTIHKAKGREFDAVAIINVDDGCFPHFSVRDIADANEREREIDESRRQMYVAITRAKRLLAFFHLHHGRNGLSMFFREMGYS